ncbi:hypothetical protein PC128_g27673 [Phytophthora cactorum]|nr:hypothetical protein PC128_g27673 [Phytophthora cactorum]
MGGGLAGNIGGFGQQMGPGMQGGNTFGGFGGQGAMGNFGQTGNNGFAGAAGGQLGCGDYVQELRTLIAGTAADPLPEAVTLTVFMEGLRTSAARTEVFCVHPSSFEEAAHRAGRNRWTSAMLKAKKQSF